MLVKALYQLMLQFRKPRLHFDYTHTSYIPDPQNMAEQPVSCGPVGAILAHESPPACTNSNADTLRYTHLQLQSCPLPSTNMYSLRHFHIWLHAQLLALTFSYVRSATPTLNYNHTLTLPIQLHHQCCPHPPTLNYNHMWLNLQFCTYRIILRWHSHPLMLNSLHWDTRLLVTFMHAWKHQISSSVLTAEPFFTYLFILQQQKENHFLPRNKNMLLFLKTTTFPENNLESSLFYTSWRMYPTVVIILVPRRNENQVETLWEQITGVS